MGFDRRFNRRLLLKEEIILEKLDSNEKGVGEYINVLVQDISRNGLGFKSEKKLEIGSFYETKLSIWPEEMIDVIIEIVRINDENDEIYYGCKFIGMSEDELLKFDVYQMFNE
ncbi:PilZ domain-containing protein [Acetitomaculum ruminis DSM 5522]|uniref:PilZ domain-containing protein n=1 Tax=Acetitomaculum ruminis DSM 5522 TaxID=1120918 RepID=A0A1I0V813_9FIRM|nr:PilZ domain-containing protein [Acetitomaculum ruminis]SFA72475.1 PilZ domain-containing protein [Acetitomaculum ruminis DSM 5522]